MPLLTEKQYRLAYKLAHGAEPTDEMVAARHHEESTLKWASEHKEFQKHKELQKVLDRLEAASEDASNLQEGFALVGMSKAGGEVDRSLRKKHGVGIGEQVWTNPVNGEVLRGTKGKAFRTRCEESMLASGWAKSRDDINW